MNTGHSNWICLQIGAREHYAIPRVLEQQQQLAYLITDTWVTPQSSFNLLPKSILSNFRERFHPQLASANVKSFNSSLIQFELKQKIEQKTGWQNVIDRNNWFQQKSVNFLKQISSQVVEPITIFAYSYAALEIFKFAKKRGWQTILGQIDPGIYEEQLVQQEHKLYPQYAFNWQFPPPKYWQHWQKECLLADKIMVNSDWSRQALCKIGIPNYKIENISLAYKISETANNFTKFYPKTFSSHRPLKVLFLGQIVLRKGVARIFKAIELLKNENIEFWFVGSIAVNIPESIKNNPKVKWFGSVSRSKTIYYYQQADVFLFPTLSDGFGLTQLEAQAWRLPIIASSDCGAVVKNKVNGLLLSEVTEKTIAQSLSFCLKNPDLLQKFSQQSSHTFSDFNLDKLGEELQLLNNNKVNIS